MPLNIEVGSIVSGKIVKIKPFGAIVSLENNIQGLIHISQVSNNFVQNINEHLTIGDVIDVKVISIDNKANKVSLSIKDLNSKGKSSSVSTKDNSVSSKSNSQNNQNYFVKNNYFSKNSDYNRLKSQNNNASLDDKLKEWLKQSNERQAGLSKRNNRR